MGGGGYRLIAADLHLPRRAPGRFHSTAAGRLSETPLAGEQRRGSAASIIDGNKSSSLGRIRRRGGAKDRDVNTNAVMNVEGVGGRSGGGRGGRPYLVKTHRRGGGRDRGDGVHKAKLLLHVSRVSDKRRERRRSRRLLPVRTSRPRGDRAIYVLMALIDGTTHGFSGAHARLNKYARKGQSLC